MQFRIFIHLNTRGSSQITVGSSRGDRTTANRGTPKRDLPHDVDRAAMPLDDLQTRAVGLPTVRRMSSSSGRRPVRKTCTGRPLARVHRGHYRAFARHRPDLRCRPNPRPARCTVTLIGPPRGRARLSRCPCPALRRSVKQANTSPRRPRAARPPPAQPHRPCHAPASVNPETRCPARDHRRWPRTA